MAGRPLESGATKLADAADDVARRPHDHGRPAMEAYLAWEEALDDKGVSPVDLLSWAR